MRNTTGLAKFGDFSFSRLIDFIVRTDRITEADPRHTHATTVKAIKTKKHTKLNTK